MGRPPLPEGERGARVDLYLSAAAQEALAELTGEESKSALVSRLLVEALAKERRKKR
jgi:hypothetical protein